MLPQYTVVSSVHVVTSVHMITTQIGGYLTTRDYIESVGNGIQFQAVLSLVSYEQRLFHSQLVPVEN